MNLSRWARLIGRKVYGFTCVMIICGVDTWLHGMSWPCAIVLVLAFLGFVLGVSGEKILAVADRVVGKK